MLEVVDEMRTRRLPAAPGLVSCLLEALAACSRWGDAPALLRYCQVRQAVQR